MKHGNQAPIGEFQEFHREQPGFACGLSGTVASDVFILIRLQ